MERFMVIAPNYYFEDYIYEKTDELVSLDSIYGSDFNCVMVEYDKMHQQARLNGVMYENERQFESTYKNPFFKSNTVEYALLMDWFKDPSIKKVFYNIPSKLALQSIFDIKCRDFDYVDKYDKDLDEVFNLISSLSDIIDNDKQLLFKLVKTYVKEVEHKIEIHVDCSISEAIENEDDSELAKLINIANRYDLTDDEAYELYAELFTDGYTIINKSRKQLVEEIRFSRDNNMPYILFSDCDSSRITSDVNEKQLDAYFKPLMSDTSYDYYFRSFSNSCQDIGKKRIKDYIKKHPEIIDKVKYIVSGETVSPSQLNINDDNYFSNAMKIFNITDEDLSPAFLYKFKTTYDDKYGIFNGYKDSLFAKSIIDSWYRFPKGSVIAAYLISAKDKEYNLTKEAISWILLTHESGEINYFLDTLNKLSDADIDRTKELVTAIVNNAVILNEELIYSYIINSENRNSVVTKFYDGKLPSAFKRAILKEELL